MNDYRIENPGIPEVTEFFDEDTNTFSYVVADSSSHKCAVIDPVLEYDPASARTSTSGADRIIDYITGLGFENQWVIETHVHADHLSAAPYVRAQAGGKIAIGANITEVQKHFGKVFNAGKGFSTDGSQFDHLFRDGERFKVGSIEGVAIHTPGHTPACMTYRIGDAAFVGDTLFMPDYGSARCDFPGGDAGQLYQSVQRIYSLPDTTRLYMCHDYKAPGREEFAWQTSVAEEKNANVHLHLGISEEEFVEMRRQRDSGLGLPRLLIPSIQVNMRAGELPEPEDNEIRYLKVPVNQL